MAILNRKFLMVGAGVGLAALLVRHGRKLLRQNRSERKLDNALDETFPASDPTATQDFAIPVNRL
jgi:hypothetical protein